MSVLNYDLAKKLKKRITIQQPVEVSDSGGGYTLSWSDLASVWAEVKPVSGREDYRALKLESKVTHKVTIRHRSDVTAGMRISMGGRVFNIRAVMNQDEENEKLLLLAEEGVAV